MSTHNICFIVKYEQYQGPVVQSIVNLTLVRGQNVNCFSKYAIYFAGIFAEKM